MNYNKLILTNRKDWRDWLEKNHNKAKDVWLVYYKKHTGKPTISYDDAVEEAICFGWIDGKVRSIDNKRYMQRYTPRKPESIWSLANKKRARKMVKKNLMTKVGFEKIEAAKKTGRWQAAYSSKEKPEFPPDFRKALWENTKAWKNFNNFTNSQQLQYIYWILGAKKKETRKQRIKEVIKRASKNQKPGVV